MDETGVDRALLVQAMGAYSDDNSYIADAARAHADRCAAVCIVDVGQHDAVERCPTGCTSGPFAGCGCLPSHARSPPGWTTAGLRVWEAAGRLEIPVVVTVLASQLGKLQNALRHFPEIPVALDHCGFPDLRGGAPFANATGLFALGDAGNLRLRSPRWC